MHLALSHPRARPAKQNIIGTYTPHTGETVVASAKGQHFRTMGRADRRGEVRLAPEETLYLLERGSLDVRLGDGDGAGWVVGLQAAYAMLVGKGGVSLERYAVYAGLKRSGYVVLRGPGGRGRRGAGGVVEETGAEAGEKERESLYVWLWRWLLERKPKPPPPFGPLVGKGLYRSYSDIYRLLSIIPYHDPTLPTARETQKTDDKLKPVHWDSDTAEPPRLPPLRPCFHVWKPRPDFKKSSPGPPDFRIAVLNARESEFPVLEQLDELLQSVPYDPPPKGIEKQTYHKLKHGYRNVILAVVDQGVGKIVRKAVERWREKRGAKGWKREGKGKIAWKEDVSAWNTVGASVER
ncbi:MAG: hypothetical protein FRX48_09427 [Lasallia pustulata]|uniref:tRNA-splicing endonuclease subunit Sen54 N-terminal domain-containing protein n=1 Tax=Lasallia pustulata TaxID=136370 RepID=A0A5M8PCP0_9LECA|nr:MAG: hypothetical protein FRX48_09427 [Lasallia pustulata]